jgi:hypothetical protein
MLIDINCGLLFSILCRGRREIAEFSILATIRIVLGSCEKRQSDKLRSPHTNWRSVQLQNTIFSESNLWVREVVVCSVGEQLAELSLHFVKLSLLT